MITGSNEDPAVNDDWVTSLHLNSTKDYTKKELVDFVLTNYPHYSFHAMWFYVGEEYEDIDNVMGKNMSLVNGAIRYGHLFNPWDTENIELISKEEGYKQDDNSWIEAWHREIAMEAGMTGGCDAYNEVMGYY